MSFWIGLRQWFSYQSEFRIPEHFYQGPIEELPGVSAALKAKADLPPTQTVVPPPPAPMPSPATDLAFPAAPAVDLANLFHRFRRNVRQLEAAQGDLLETKNLAIVTEKMEKLLKEQGMVCKDLSGEPFDEGRVDFDPIPGTPEVRAGIKYPLISSCERPLVELHGRQLQPAKGFVVHPR